MMLETGLVSGLIATYYTGMQNDNDVKFDE
jgi:hypothetical protein